MRVGDWSRAHQLQGARSGDGLVVPSGLEGSRKVASLAKT